MLLFSPKQAGPTPKVSSCQALVPNPQSRGLGLTLKSYAPSHVPLQIHSNPASYDMTRVNLLFLGLLVWTSLSVADDDGDYDYIGEDEDTYDVMDDVDESTEALSAEGKECLLNLINDCLVENEGSAEACEGLTKQLEVSSYIFYYI